MANNRPRSASAANGSGGSAPRHLGSSWSPVTGSAASRHARGTARPNSAGARVVAQRRGSSASAGSASRFLAWSAGSTALVSGVLPSVAASAAAAGRRHAMSLPSRSSVASKGFPPTSGSKISAAASTGASAPAATRTTAQPQPPPLSSSSMPSSLLSAAGSRGMTTGSSSSSSNNNNNSSNSSNSNSKGSTGRGLARSRSSDSVRSMSSSSSSASSSPSLGSTARRRPDTAGSSANGSSDAPRPFGLVASKERSYNAAEDAVALSEHADGHVLAERSEAQRAVNPERVNLSRRKLTVCPVLQGEARLRLLNLQHNRIREICNMVNLPNLIFLDLYSNNITHLAGLSSLASLRVLMLGKNAITRISALESLTRLDVLDLHNNAIGCIENLATLTSLRVLNLAGNQITEVAGLRGLRSLTELNLRRNRVASIRDLHTLPALQHVFLSSNNLRSFERIASLLQCRALTELTLDGNPLAADAVYRPLVLHAVPSLRLLDLKRVADDERRQASVVARREAERAAEEQRRARAHEERAAALAQIRLHWEQRELGNAAAVNTTGVWELDSRTLTVSGHALECLNNERTWIAEHVVFAYLDIEGIAAALPRLRRFQSLRSVTLMRNRINRLAQLDVLARLPHSVEHVTVEDNPVVASSQLLRAYVAARLAFIKRINDRDIDTDDLNMAVHVEALLRRVNSLTTSINNAPASDAAASGSATANPASAVSSYLDVVLSHGRYVAECSQDAVSTGHDDVAVHDAATLATTQTLLQDAWQGAADREQRLARFHAMWPEIVQRYIDEAVDGAAHVS